MLRMNLRTVWKALQAAVPLWTIIGGTVASRILTTELQHSAETHRIGQISERLLPCDPESRLARGEPLEFKNLDLTDLLLIPQVSETLAQSLLQHRGELLAEVASMSDRDTLLTISGIGPKTAERLGQFITFRRQNVRLGNPACPHAPFLPLQAHARTTPAGAAR